MVRVFGANTPSRSKHEALLKPLDIERKSVLHIEDAPITPGEWSII